MARLIDADALAAELFRHHVHDGEDLEPLLYLVDAQNLIATAPAVDAIPVEWLEKRLNETAYSDPDLNNAIFQVLVDWEKQKKREAKHDTV